MLGLSFAEFKLTSEHRQLFRNTEITHEGPGTILRDFGMLLEFIGVRGLGITGTHQLPMQALPVINLGLTHPLRQGLSRPQQKSYPHVNGLFLLLRASGFTLLGGTSKKPLLFVDEEVAQAWRGLNPTEQYFTLLETWLVRAEPEIIGEPHGFYSMRSRFLTWMDFFEKIKKKGLQVAGCKDAEDRLHYTGWYNVALFELFGLIAVQHGPLVEGKAWNIERIFRTPLGDALVALFFSEPSKIEAVMYGSEDREEVPPGVLQPIVQPYFPEWRSNLAVPKWIPQGGTYTFKVSMGRLWYRIAIPADHSLDALASAILDAVEFDHDHLYQFSYKNRRGVVERVFHPYMEEGPWTSELSLGDVPLGIGQTMTFLFDFGDEWMFDVTLERIEPDKVADKPVLLEMHGKPPRQYPIVDEE